MHSRDHKCDRGSRLAATPPAKHRGSTLLTRDVCHNLRFRDSDSLAPCFSPSMSATPRPCSACTAASELTDHWRLATERSHDSRRARRPAERASRLRRRRRDLPRLDGARARAGVGSARGQVGTRSTTGRRAGVKTGIPIRYDDPREVGPDRIVNAVAAKARYGAPVIVVDFGTSTNFDVVSPEGEYVGGVLAPGVEISMEALFSRAARLVKVDYAAPSSVIGKTTVAALQSGLVYGFAGQVDGIVGRDSRGAGRGGSGHCDRRTRGSRCAALAHDRARRSVPDTRRASARLGAESVIPDAPAIGLFVVAALALLLVPGPAVAVRRGAFDSRGSPRRARVGGRNSRRHARPHRSGHSRTCRR